MGWVDAERQRADRWARDREYAQSVRDWLDQHFPDVATHPAAFVAVRHLHSRYGKGHLTAREHGPMVRAAVARFDAKYEETPV